MMCVQSLTVEGCFQINLLKRERFSVLKSQFKTCTDEHDFIRWKPIMVQYATYKSVMGRIEPSSAHQLFGEVGNILCPIVEILK